MADKRLSGLALAGCLTLFSLAAYGAQFLVTDAGNVISKNEKLFVVGTSTYTGCGYVVGYKVESSSAPFSIAVSTDLVIGSTITVSRSVGTACPGHAVFKFTKK